MSRAFVSVASDSWVKGQARLITQLRAQGEQCEAWSNALPAGCPPHRDRGLLRAPMSQCVPYAFKAYAMHEAAYKHDLLIWADACILPIKPLDLLWERIERDGYWFARNGYWNSDWTADSAYPDLFDTTFGCGIASGDAFRASIEADYQGDRLHHWREINAKVPHVVGTCFGINAGHPLGHMFLAEYYRLASTTKAFCGPWQNTNAPTTPGRNTDRPSGPCGPPTTLGHRHDQSAASVIAWRLGFKLTECPNIFAYSGSETEETLLIADGNYA